MKIEINEILTKTINDWDPLQLFPGAPEDEYILEVNEIAVLLKKSHTIESLALEINNVFSNSFGSDIFFNRENECKKIARIIIENYNCI